jgi:hypothetical protein
MLAFPKEVHMAHADTSRSLADETLRFRFRNGPMKGKEFDHTFHTDGKVEWGPSGSDQKTISEGRLVRIGDDCYVGSYVGPNGYTLTAALNLASGKLVAFASDGKECRSTTARSARLPDRQGQSR